MCKKKSLATLFWIALLGFLCGCRSASEERQLNYTILTSGTAPAAPVDYREMAIPEKAAAPLHTFSGSLELLDEAQNGSFKKHSGWFGSIARDQILPEFDFAFIQSDSYLIPLQRGRILTAHPSWNYILEPGRVWQEETDQGMTRASFPFALLEKNDNCVYNGVMTFLFDDQGISKVWYQITQETAIEMQADWWGLLGAAYHPQELPEAKQVRQNFSAELSARMPVRPLEQLAVDYPGLDVPQIGKEITRDHMTAYGMVINGTHYLGPCRTRSGDYPYCEEMRMPSWSTSKSGFAAVALMRLAQIYGSQVPDLLVKDYLPETLNSPGNWQEVTFNNTLDMATGNYVTTDPMDDESSPRTMRDFFGVNSFSAKLNAASKWPHGGPPGRDFVYHSTDTFVLVSALQNYLSAQMGSPTDLFDFIVEEVYRPLGMGPGFFSTLRTSENNWNGQPIGSFGLWWTPADVAQMAAFLNNAHGEISGEQILDASMLDSALQRNPDDPGLPTEPRARYQNGFWASQFGPTEGYSCEFWVPYMSGYTGVTVALLPNGISYYYFSDNYEFAWAGAVRETDKIKPLCLE